MQETSPDQANTPLFQRVGSGLLRVVSVLLLSLGSFVAIAVLTLALSMLTGILAFVFDWNLLWALVPIILGWLLLWLLYLFDLSIDPRNPARKLQHGQQKHRDDSDA